MYPFRAGAGDVDTSAESAVIQRHIAVHRQEGEDDRAHVADQQHDLGTQTGRLRNDPYRSLSWPGMRKEIESGGSPPRLLAYGGGVWRRLVHQLGAQLHVFVWRLRMARLPRA